MKPSAQQKEKGPAGALLRSFSHLAAGETGARVLGFLAVVFLARRLGPGGFGLVAFGMALVTWFRIVVDAGTEFLAVRDVARTPARFRAIAEPILGLRLALSAGAVMVFLMGAAVIPAAASDREAVVLFALMLPVIALNLRWMVLGVDRARAVAAGNVVSQLLVVVGVFVLVQDQDDVWLVPLVLAAGELGYGALVVAAVARRFGIPRPRIDLRLWREVVRAGFPLSVSHLARTALYSFDVLLIAALLARTDVGLYAAAYKPVMFGSVLVGLLSVSFLATYSASTEAAERLKLVRLTVATAGGVAVAGALILTLGAETLLTVVLGQEFGGGATALAILAWTLPLLAVTGPYTSALIAADRQKLVMRNNLIAAGFNVGANLAAVPLAGIEGAAAVTVASFVIVMALSFRDATRLGLAPPIGGLRVPREREVAIVASVAADSESA